MNYGTTYENCMINLRESKYWIFTIQRWKAENKWAQQPNEEFFKKIKRNLMNEIAKCKN